MPIRLTWLLLAALLAAGCPTDPANPGDPDDDPLVRTDFDGQWRVVSETGLVNNCVTILGDSVTQFADCNGAARLLLESGESVRSGERIIWSFTLSADDGEEQHTLAVDVQPDDTLRGTYSIRTPGSMFAVTDDVIMVRREVGD